MAHVSDVWIRRIVGRGDLSTCGPTDFLHIGTDGTSVGIWGPISSTQSYFVLAFLREKLLGLPLQDALDAVDHSARSRHATGYLVMACTACDLAIWDLLGQESHLPLSALFGRAPIRSQVHCYASLLGRDVLAPQCMEQMQELNRCYWGLKWAARIDESDGASGILSVVRGLDWIRSCGVSNLMVDALCAWTPAYAHRFVTESRSLRLTWLEEPFLPDNLRAYRNLAAGASIPIAAGEHAYSPEDICSLIDCGVRVLQPDAAWCGGLASFIEILSIAQQSGCSVFPHGGGLLPALHASAIYGEEVVPALEFHLSVEPKRQAFWRNKFFPQKGFLEVPSSSGLGIEIDEDLILTSRELRRVEWL